MTTPNPTSRFCPNCGKPVAMEARFCPACGATIPQLAAPQAPPQAPMTPPVPSVQAPPTPAYPSYGPSYQTPYQQPYQQPKKSNTKIIIAVIIIVVVVLAGLGTYAAYSFFNGFNSAFTQHSQVIVNGQISVPAGNYYYYQITIPSGAIIASINGNFTAAGGSGNDIIVLVMDQTNYVNWQNAHSASAYYNSGQVTTGTILANLPGSGSYYLVYDNTFSTASGKTVQTTAVLNYHG